MTVNLESVPCLAFGVFLILFQDAICKNIFPKLSPAEAYRRLLLINVAAWSVAIVGIAAGVFVSRGPIATVKADCGVAIGGGASATATNTGDCADAKKEGADDAPVSGY